jgi:hypothetical protein
MLTRAGRLNTILLAALVLLISIGGMWLLRKSTPFGLGLNTDGVYYVNGARNILAGNGFYRNSGEDVLKPITHFPPLFAYILSGVGLTGLDPLRGGRLVIILLYGIDTILFSWLVWKLTRSRWLVLLAAGVMAFSSVNLREYSWLMSEPLYICLLLVSFLIAADYFESRKSGLILVLGILSGLMYATRYVGLSMLLTWLVAICLFIPGWREKLRQAGLFLLTSLPFLLAVMVRNYLLTGSTGNRNFILHWAPFTKIAYGIQRFWGWFLPPDTQSFYAQLEWVFITLFFLLLLAALGVLAWRLLRVMRGQTCSPFENLLLMLGVHVVIYLASVYIAMNFFDATTVFDDRMLLPVYMIMVLFILVALEFIWKRGKPFIRLLVLTGSIAALVFAMVGASHTTMKLSQDGQGFIDRYRRESPTMQYVREHDMDLFYTNQPPTVYIQTGKTGYMVPSAVDSLTLQARDSYAHDLAEMKTKINAQDGFLVFFYELGYETDPWYLDLTEGLVPMENLPDGIIWGRLE